MLRIRRTHAQAHATTNKRINPGDTTQQNTDGNAFLYPTSCKITSRRIDPWSMDRYIYIYIFFFLWISVWRLIISYPSNWTERSEWRCWDFYIPTCIPNYWLAYMCYLPTYLPTDRLARYIQKRDEITTDEYGVSMSWYDMLVLFRSVTLCNKTSHYIMTRKTRQG